MYTMKSPNMKTLFFNHAAIYFANDLLREMLLFTRKWHGAITPQQADAYHFLKAIKANLPQFEATQIPVMMQHPFPKSEQLQAITQYLNNNIDTTFSFEQVAHHFGYSTRTLSRKFKEDVGMNYVRYVRSLRINKAFQLLTEQKHNLNEIALLVGYSSLATFSNIFFKLTGIRPSEYAKSLKK